MSSKFAKVPTQSIMVGKWWVDDVIAIKEVQADGTSKIVGEYRLANSDGYKELLTMCITHNKEAGLDPESYSNANFNSNKKEK